MFGITNQTPLLVSINLIIVVLCYYVLKPAYVYPCNLTKQSRNLGIFLIFTFTMFSFWGADWFGYIVEYESVRTFGSLHTHLEDVYVWIIENIAPTYLIFRLVVWGSATLLCLKTFNRLNIKYNLALLVFSTTWLAIFSYARVSLAMAIMFFGATFLYKPYKDYRKISFAFGLMLIFVSYFFHKSAAFGIACIMVAYFTKTQNKNVLLASLLAFPVLVILFQGYLADFMLMDTSDAETTAESFAAAGQRYMGHEEHSSGLGTTLQRILNRSPFYLLAYMIYKLHGLSEFKNVPEDICLFLRICFFIVLFSSVFFFDLGVNTITIYSRFLKFSSIPATISLTYILENNYFRKLGNLTYRLAVAGTIYSITYMMYNSAVH